MVGTGVERSGQAREESAGAQAKVANKGLRHFKSGMHVIDYARLVNLAGGMCVGVMRTMRSVLQNRNLDTTTKCICS